jgi:hypothetical protein
MFTLPAGKALNSEGSPLTHHHHFTNKEMRPSEGKGLLKGAGGLRG